MFISASSELYPELFLLKLGDSCHYVVQADGTSWLFDPGTPLHVMHLERRLADLGQQLHPRSKCLLTHLHAERVGGIAALKSLHAGCEVFASGPMKEHMDDSPFMERMREDLQRMHKLRPSADWTVPDAAELQAALEPAHLLVDSDCLKLSESLSLRVVGSPLHTDHSLLYYLEPARFLIVDEGLGYFRGKDLSSPGADLQLKSAHQFVEKIIDLDVAAICFPFMGVITGELVGRYLKSMNDAVEQLYAAVARARQDTIPTLEIQQSIREQFYSLPTRDPFLKYCLERTYQAIWEQLR